jgi:threonine dehydrogenase-like Zn-dependent dehydrogenase
MIDTAMRAAPAGSQVVVVGLCMQPDHFSPALGISKRLTLTFVLGWTPAEFDASLAGIADGTLDVAPLVTDEVGIDGVADAFDRLADPADQVKILVRPNEEMRRRRRSGGPGWAPDRSAMSPLGEEQSNGAV